MNEEPAKFGKDFQLAALIDIEDDVKFKVELASDIWVTCIGDENLELYLNERPEIRFTKMR